MAWCHPGIRFQVSEEKINKSQTSQEISVIVLTTYQEVDHSVKMYNSQIPTTSTQLQRIPLNNQLFDKVMKNQVLNFSRNPWEHLSQLESWNSSDSEEGDSSVSGDTKTKGGCNTPVFLFLRIFLLFCNESKIIVTL